MPITARAAVLHAPNDLRIEQVTVDDPAPHEVRLRVEACGLCGSDLHYVDGELRTRFPMVVGHEAPGSWTRWGTPCPGCPRGPGGDLHVGLLRDLRSLPPG